GVLAALPATQANIADGTFRNGKALTFETSVRGMVAFLEAGEGTFAEDFDARRLFDNRGLAAAGVFSSRGDYLFVALRGHRAIERLDVLNASQSGTILNTGYAPDGVALSDDDRFLFVNASLSRLLQVYDVTSFDALPVPIAEVSLVEAEPLDPEILRGKQLFNDSFDPRLARDGYIACAHCHLEGDSDHRVWDFTDRGEGLRRTPPLFGRMDNLPLHWSGNFDEVQDFENDIRGPFGGSGLMATPDFREREDTLGVPKAGQSEELDALAAYVNSLTEHLSSPFRDSAGDLTEAATRGRAVFLSAGCPTCHEGSELTDSGFVSPGVPRLHDVGTLGPGSGSRLGEPLTGLDTPTLHGLWHQASFLHDGSATLEEVIGARNASDTHGNTSTLSETERADLVSYLLSLDGRVD
ncbi:MAG: cytochrome c peroxidase, partial [Myxococcota bacterium]